jgi:hypothetical protein
MAARTDAAMTSYYAPLDPDCPVASEFLSALLSDPMSRGAPLDDIVAEFRRKHRFVCERCLAFGLAHIEIRED